MRNSFFKIARCVIPLLILPCIGTVAYAEQFGGFAYEYVAPYITITEYSGSDAHVIIPPDINGTNVTTIGDGAFNGCSGLTSITIPDGVTGIGDWAFSSCSGLTSITIPDSVTSIGRSAFYNCVGLTSIAIPNSVTSIGGNALKGCSGLTATAIPNSGIL